MSTEITRRSFIGAALLGAGAAIAPPSRGSPVLMRKRESGSELKGFDQWVTSVLAEWNVPGAAVGVIRNGHIVLANGYGYRNLEKKLAATPRTLFPIGSSTKSFTALILGMLSDQNKLEWDTPVREYLPDFQLFDDVATKLMTPRDLLTHRSGLPGHNAIFHGRSYTRDELYRRLRFLEPNVTFRQRYQYNNLMVMTAGVLAERITGQTWEELVRERIFTPLGMTRSNCSVKEIPEADDYSLPYAEVNNQIVEIPFRNIDAVGPTGSINSSVEEMLRYLQLRIDFGTYQGKALVSAATAAELQSPQSAQDMAASEYPELGPGCYGLGVNLNHYRGRRIVFHGGGIDGFFSSMSWLPDDKIGVIVLTNSGGGQNLGVPPVYRLIAHDVIDRLLGVPAIDWLARERERHRDERAQAAAVQQKEAAVRFPHTTPSHALSVYAGAYEHPGYGLITVSEAGGGLILSLDRLTVPLEHSYCDVFRTVRPSGGEWQWGIGAGRRVVFAHGKDGDINRLEVDLEPAVSDIAFKRNG